MTDNLKEREAFEAEFPPPHGVAWDGSAYTVNADYINSYRCDRFVGQWAAWQARAAIEADRVSRDVPAGWRDLLISLTMHASEAGDHTEESFRRGVIRLANQAHKFLAASPQPQPVQASDEDDCCRCEPSDWVAPSDYDGDGSVDGLARRAAMQSAQPVQASQCLCKDRCLHAADVSRCRGLPSVLAQPVQAQPRQLTTRELADVTAPWSNVWIDQSFGIANAAIAKFCEVNGIGTPATVEKEGE